MMRTLLIVILLVLFIALVGVREAFGMSPGTLTQLQSTHVPTMEDVRAARHEVREIAAMTGSPLF